jgi:hypothetical protein
MEQRVQGTVELRLSDDYWQQMEQVMTRAITAALAGQHGAVNDQVADALTKAADQLRGITDAWLPKGA